MRVHGFTIVELLISITVLILLVTFSFANYAKTNQKQTLIAAGQNIKTVLRDAQSRAFSGEVDCTVCGCGSTSFEALDGWYVDLEAKTIYGTCGSSQILEKTFSISEDITIISNLSSQGPIFFRHTPPGTDKHGTICIKYKDLTDSFFAITLSSSGEVSDTGVVTVCP